MEQLLIVEDDIGLNQGLSSITFFRSLLQGISGFTGF